MIMVLQVYVSVRWQIDYRLRSLAQGKRIDGAYHETTRPVSSLKFTTLGPRKNMRATCLPGAPISSTSRGSSATL